MGVVFIITDRLKLTQSGVSPMRKWPVLFLFVVVFLAGCSGFLGPDSGTETPTQTATQPTPVDEPSPTVGQGPTDTPSRTPASTLTPTQTGENSPTPSSTPTPPSTPTPSETSTAASSSEVNNPWGDEEITIGVTNRGFAFRSLTDEVREGVRFWQVANRTAYEGSLAFRPNATNPDILVSIESEIQQCGGEQLVEATYKYCTVGLNTTDSKVEGAVSVNITGQYVNSDITNITTVALSPVIGVEESALNRSLPDVDTTQFRNPWPKQRNVTVGVENSVVNDSRNLTPLVEEAVVYWRNRTEYTSYTANFVVEPNASDPDLLVDYVSEIPRCGVEHNTDMDHIGCAPVLTTADHVLETKSVRIEAGYTDESTLRTLKHEFGHIYGLRHNDEPQEVMQAAFETTSLPEPNATERSYTFRTQTVPVYINSDSISGEQDEIRQQVEYATDYYSSGADGSGPNLTFEFVDNRTAGAIVITGNETIAQCQSASRVSCGIVYGENLDRDAPVEYYTKQYIQLNDPETGTIGWHVGYWLSQSILAAQTTDEIPPPFSDASKENKRNWYR